MKETHNNQINLTAYVASAPRRQVIWGVSHSIPMYDYLYRVDSHVGIKKIQDNHFRARRWISDDIHSFPHKLLKQLHSELSTTEGLFRICFFTSQARAEQCIQSYLFHFDESVILRCPKLAVLNLGFNESWDDGFEEGAAYLFWVKEKISSSNTDFSAVGITLDQFEIWEQGQWYSLKDYCHQKAALSAQIIKSPEDIDSSIPMPKKKLWWKFW